MSDHGKSLEIKLIQDDLVLALEKIDLHKFSRELCEFGIVSKRVKENFSTLDCDRLDPKLRVRYLLQQVFDKVCQDNALFPAFLIVLSSVGKEVMHVYNYLNERCVKGEARTVGGPSQAHDNDRCLTEQDIPDLVTELASVAYKWEEISILLGLPDHVIEECRTGSSFMIKLRRSLHAWITGAHPHVKRIALNTLKDILSGPSLGCSNLADQMTLADTLLPPPKRPCLSCNSQESIPSIWRQSIDTEVVYGKSTLLEVQVNCTSSVTYQWSKDGLEISDGDSYQGSTSSILLINTASQHVEGKYVCCMNNEVSSSEAVVTVRYPDTVRYLRNKYSKKKEFPKDSWPPVGIQSFIKLALISRPSSRQSIINENYDYSVRGDMDDILKKKEKIHYQDAFGKYESGAVVLVDGRPGSGKTTLAHKITKDWNEGRNILEGAELVFLIPLRLLGSEIKDRILSDILKLFYDKKLDTSNVANSLESVDGERMCFILDGLDEYEPYRRGSETVIKGLLEGILPKAMIIVLSRPVGSAKLMRCVNAITKRIEILGFSKKHIDEYIDKYFSNDEQRIGLKHYLKSHINVLHMCYLPVHAAMICYLYTQQGDDIPSTETKIYECFTELTILRMQTRGNESSSPTSLDKSNGKDEACFSNICKLAAEMVTNNKQIFWRKDTEVQLSDESGSDGPSLGLVTVDSTAKLYGYEEVYTFLHLTFQEYLAACYISELDEKEQLKYITKYLKKETMLVVWKFYCGMVNYNDRLHDHLRLILNVKGADDMYRVHCAFESQHSMVCDIALNCRPTGSLTFSNKNLLPGDYEAIRFVISSLSTGTLRLTFQRCKLVKDEVKYLLNISNTRLDSFKSLTIHRRTNRIDEFEILNIFLGKMHFLERLDFRHSTSGKLNITKAAALADGLKSCTNLKTLNISGNSIGSDDAAAIADGLRSCTNLQTLDITRNNIGSDGAAALADCLKSCTNLQTLDITRNNIGSDGASALADGLKSCTNLQTLNISFNNIGSDGAAALADGLKSCTNLQTLDIDSNNIGSDGASALADGLKSYTNLQKLNISLNNIGSDGAAALADGLKSCTNLQILD